MSTQPATITLDNATVHLDWEDGKIIRATHTVPTAEIEAGPSAGPMDGDKFSCAGRTWEIGQHEYESEDGQTTCWASVELVDTVYFISISQDGQWAGTGKLTVPAEGYPRIGCTAVLGDNQDMCDRVYEAIEEQIGDMQDFERGRLDGYEGHDFSWTINAE